MKEGICQKQPTSSIHTKHSHVFSRWFDPGNLGFVLQKDFSCNLQISVCLADGVFCCEHLDQLSSFPVFLAEFWCALQVNSACLWAQTSHGRCKDITRTSGHSKDVYRTSMGRSVLIGFLAKLWSVLHKMPPVIMSIIWHSWQPRSRWFAGQFRWLFLYFIVAWWISENKE